MFLVELFTTVYPFRVMKDTEDDYRANFWDPKALVPVSFYAERSSAQAWEVTFARGREVTVTGQGNAFKIFSTVLEIFKEFLRHKQPEYVFFTADEANRQSLYKTMIEKMAAEQGYKLHQQMGHGFVLKKVA